MRGSLFLLAAFLVTPHKEHCVDTAAGRPARSRPPSLGQLACRPGESGSAHSQHDAKVAEVAVTTVRTAGRGGLPRKRPVQIICPLRPPASRRQIFLPAPT